MTLLDVQHITKRFGGLTAVNDVSFHVDKGEVVSIIGPNGAGKTTVFNILTGVYEIEEGKIFFEGKEIQNQAPQAIVKAGISRTFQNIRLFMNMRVLENVLVGTHINTEYSFLDALFRTPKWKRIEAEKTKRAIQILKSIGLEYRMHDYAKNLPYGEQRKLEIARAIATGAKLLLLDEPAAGMNPQETQELSQFIHHIRDEYNLTILIIEHHMDLVMQISDRIYVLDFGKLIAEGTPAQIQNNKRVIDAYLGVAEDA